MTGRSPGSGSGSSVGVGVGSGLGSGAGHSSSVAGHELTTVSPNSLGVSTHCHRSSSKTQSKVHGVVYNAMEPPPSGAQTMAPSRTSSPEPGAGRSGVGRADGDFEGGVVLPSSILVEVIGASSAPSSPRAVATPSQRPSVSATAKAIALMTDMSPPFLIFIFLLSREKSYPVKLKELIVKCPGASRTRQTTSSFSSTELTCTLHAIHLYYHTFAYM